MLEEGAAAMAAIRVPPIRPLSDQPPERSPEEYAEIAQRRWWELGYTDARIWVERKRRGRSETRSNLVGGLPPSARGETPR